MTATDQTPVAPHAAKLAAANKRIDSYIDALLGLRNLIAERPDLAEHIALAEYGPVRINAYLGSVPTNDTAGLIADLAQAAERHGATVAPDLGEKYGGAAATFGPFELYLYAPVDQVGSTRQIEVWDLDPRLAAFGTGASA